MRFVRRWLRGVISFLAWCSGRVGRDCAGAWQEVGLGYRFDLLATRHKLVLGLRSCGVICSRIGGLKPGVWRGFGRGARGILQGFVALFGRMFVCGKGFDLRVKHPEAVRAVRSWGPIRFWSAGAFGVVLGLVLGKPGTGFCGCLAGSRYVV